MNLYILHLGAAFGRARLELSSLVRKLRAPSGDEKRRIHDGHCWHLAVVEGEEEVSQGGSAIAMAGESDGMYAKKS